MKLVKTDRLRMGRECCLHRCWTGIIYLTDVLIDEFLKINPPCKECLVQAMCISDISLTYNQDLYKECIKFKPCVIIENFLKEVYNLSDIKDID